MDECKLKKFEQTRNADFIDGISTDQDVVNLFAAKFSRVTAGQRSLESFYETGSDIDKSCCQFSFSDVKRFMMKFKTKNGFEGIHTNHFRYISIENLNYLGDENLSKMGMSFAGVSLFAGELFANPLTYIN